MQNHRHHHTNFSNQMTAQNTCTQLVWILLLSTTRVLASGSSSDSHTIYMNDTNQIVHCGNTTDCIVLCQTTCSDSVVNASFAKSLRFSCSSYATCERMTIIGPSEFANVICGPCKNSSFLLMNTTNVEIRCLNSCEHSNISVQ
eukprot:249646_1